MIKLVILCKIKKNQVNVCFEKGQIKITTLRRFSLSAILILFMAFFKLFFIFNFLEFQKKSSSTIIKLV
jgi:hypothetical protein